MELSKQEMELFLLFPDFRLKNFFYKMFLSFNNDTKTGFENRKWNYPNRKWNYFRNQNFSGTKILREPKFFGNQNFSGTKIFWEPKFLGTKNFSEPNNLTKCLTFKNESKTGLKYRK